MNVKYWTSAGRALARHARHSPGFLESVLSAGLTADAQPQGEVRDLFAAFPEIEDVELDMGRVTYRRSNLDPFEQFVLGAIARLRRPNRVFEIGTYDGATTSLIARAAPDAEILTLDLPPQAADAATEADEISNVGAGNVGARFQNSSEASRITQLLGDSRTFDFQNWYGTIDLVLVDGGHAYETVKADTATALRLLAPRGMIVWDDYVVGWPGVVRAVDQSGVSVFRVAGTGFGIHDSAVDFA